MPSQRDGKKDNVTQCLFIKAMHDVFTFHENKHRMMNKEGTKYLLKKLSH